MWRTIVVDHADRRVGGRGEEEVMCMIWRSAPREVDREIEKGRGREFLLDFEDMLGGVMRMKRKDAHQ